MLVFSKPILGGLHHEYSYAAASCRLLSLADIDLDGVFGSDRLF